MPQQIPRAYERNRAYYIARETSEAGKKKRVLRDQARTAEIKAGKLKSRIEDDRRSYKTAGEGRDRCEE